jgi:hypothetical protein
MGVAKWERISRRCLGRVVDYEVFKIASLLFISFPKPTSTAEEGEGN